MLLSFRTTITHIFIISTSITIKSVPTSFKNVQGKKNSPKHELIDMIITGKDNKSIVINNNFTVENAKKILDKVRSKPQS